MTRKRSHSTIQRTEVAWSDNLLRLLRSAHCCIGLLDGRSGGQIRFPRGLQVTTRSLQADTGEDISRSGVGGVLSLGMQGRVLEGPQPGEVGHLFDTMALGGAVGHTGMGWEGRPDGRRSLHTFHSKIQSAVPRGTSCFDLDWSRSVVKDRPLRDVCRRLDCSLGPKDFCEEEPAGEDGQGCDQLTKMRLKILVQSLISLETRRFWMIERSKTERTKSKEANLFMSY